MHVADTIKLDSFMARLSAKNQAQPEYIQAVHEVLMDVVPWIQDNPNYAQSALLERICEPDRVIAFKVVWENDAGQVCINKGYRVQSNNALGPYKGGLRFHPSVNISVLKFLGFEQTFKNSLTGLSLGAGKGGSDFDPKGKSVAEIKRFCQAFSTALLPFIGKDTDVPAGDIGVGSREISYMFGHMQRIAHVAPGILTGKSLAHGGSQMRLEATGYGAVYLLEDILQQHNDNIIDKKVLISGSGNVALYAAEKLIQLGAKVITLSDSKGFLHIPDGLDSTKLAAIMQLRFQARRGLAEIISQYPELTYYAGSNPWHVPADIAMPCATENEIDTKAMQKLCAEGIKIIVEGANMPVTQDAIELLRDNNIIFAPGKAANAGGVAVSGLEMVQNAMGYMWSREEVDAKLRKIMQNIHKQCLEFSQHLPGEVVNYTRGANIVGFKRVADAMLAYGV